MSGHDAPNLAAAKKCYKGPPSWERKYGVDLLLAGIRSALASLWPVSD
ncbi:hypothetical protein [Halomicronema sp. CCY15110]|nr:hypothetical protein [Halomicronema sp. CCY15110]